VVSMLIICLFLSFSLAVATLMVLHLRRQRRGLQAVLQKVLQKEFHRADEA